MREHLDEIKKKKAREGVMCTTVHLTNSKEFGMVGAAKLSPGRATEASFRSLRELAQNKHGGVNDD